jgi:hypothetical protein
MYKLLLLLLFLVLIFVSFSWALTPWSQNSSLDDTTLAVYCHPL